MAIDLISNIRSPIKWAGGKSRLRKVIIQALPEHKCYVEVFGGAGWVLLGKKSSKVEIFNDIDGDIVNLFRVIKVCPEKFLDSFLWDLTSREVFNRLKVLNPESLDEIERAHRFFYLIMAAWGGELALPRFQTSVNDGGHGNRLIGALKNLESRIMPVHQRLQTVIIENLSWEKCIERYDREYEKDKVVMFLDPPYPDNHVNYRHNMRLMDQHKPLVNVLQTLKSRFLLTCYDLPEIRDLYKNFRITPVEFAGGMPIKENKTNRNREIIVTNYDLPLSFEGIPTQLQIQE